MFKRRERILEFLREYTSKYGYPPTVREICRAVDLSSTNTVSLHLDVLARDGLIQRNRLVARGITMADSPVRRIRTSRRKPRPMRQCGQTLAHGNQMRASTIEFIREYLDHHGYPPSVRDVAGSLQVCLTTAAHHLNTLERLGVIQRIPGIPRSIALTDRAVA